MAVEWEDMDLGFVGEGVDNQYFVTKAWWDGAARPLPKGRYVIKDGGSPLDAEIDARVKLKLDPETAERKQNEGDLSELETTDKSSLTAAVNETLRSALLKLSDVTQGLYSDVALKTYTDGQGAPNAYRLLGTALDGTEHALIEMYRDGAAQLAAIGAETVRLNLKTKGGADTDNRVIVDTQDGEGEPVRLSLAYLADVVAQCADALASAKAYTDGSVEALRLDSLILQPPCKESGLPQPDPENPWPSSHNGYWYQISDFDVSHPGQGYKGTATWHDDLGQGVPGYYLATDKYGHSDGVTTKDTGEGEIAVNDLTVTDVTGDTDPFPALDASPFLSFVGAAIKKINGLFGLVSALGTGKADDSRNLLAPAADTGTPAAVSGGSLASVLQSAWDYIAGRVPSSRTFAGLSLEQNRSVTDVRTQLNIPADPATQADINAEATTRYNADAAEAAARAGADTLLAQSVADETAEREAAVEAEAEAREEALEAKVDKLTGSGDCDLVYVKHADGTQGYQELRAEPEANAIPSRDDYGVLYAQAGGNDNSVVVKSQLDAEAEARDEAIAEAVEAEAEARDEAIAEAASGKLDKAGGTMSGDLDMGGKSLTNSQSVGTNFITPAEPDANDTVKVWANLDMDGNAVRNLPSPDDEGDAANRKYVDDTVAEAQLATHTWLPAVQKKALLPTPEKPDKLNYLCRVIADAETPANNGVWEWIAGSDEWTYFSDNQDWIDETELAAAVGEEATARDEAIEAHDADSAAHSGLFAAKQDTLASGTNIKTVNNESLLGSGNIGIITAYTYAVDSDEALAAWAGNAEGNDYTSVLIKPGTWTSAVQVNLTASGTKVVTGMPGSVLSFTSGYGLRYDSLPATNDYRMDGVTVTVTAPSSSLDCYGFYYCINLTNCTATATAISGGGGFGFANCNNLTNCIGTGTTGGGQSRGFSGCENLINCTATGIGTATSYGFRSCKGMLFNKPGSASTTGTYGSCYVSPSGSGAAPANTAEGGWNRS